MMSEALIAILEIPLVIRVAIVMFIFWLIYLLVAQLAVRLISLVPRFFNWVWSLIYNMLSGIAHLLHSRFGKSFIGIDQTITDFFGSVYGFVDKMKLAIEKAGKTKRPFAGKVFLLVVALTIWIALPTWLESQYDENLFTMPYRMYIEFEDRLFDILFSDSQN